MSEDIDKDIFKALCKARNAFDESVSLDGWDTWLEIKFSVRELDEEGRTVRLINLSNEEKVS